MPFSEGRFQQRETHFYVQKQKTGFLSALTLHIRITTLPDEEIGMA